MTTTQLKLYNEAIRLVGGRKLSSLSENREPRRLLDEVWDNDGVRTCLEMGLWNFAMRTSEITYNPSVEPTFGYERAFDKPTDLVRTAAVCTDGHFTNPLLRYSDEAAYWFADFETIYVRYVSDDNAYGNDLSLWPYSFGRMVAAWFALEIVERLTQSTTNYEKLNKVFGRRATEARSRDAMNEATAFPPAGSWVSARAGGWGTHHRERGTGGIY